MKVLTLLPFVLPAVLAAPAVEEQTLLSDIIGYSDLTGGIFGEIVRGVEHIVQGAEKVAEKEVEQWAEGGREFVKQNGLVCKSAQTIVSSANDSYLELRRACLTSFVY
jgi:hypothetical protein